MISINCATCSIRFDATDELFNRRKKDGRAIWCPNGHRTYFTPSPTEADKLREQLESFQRRLESLQRSYDSTDEEKERYKRQWAAQKGVATKLRQKIEIIERRIKYEYTPI